ncbi:MAG: GNAT family N-acetyltransferase [Pseudomonadota bacterium]
MAQVRNTLSGLQHMNEFTPVRSETALSATRVRGLRLAVITRADQIKDEWLSLQKSGWVTPYQSFDWVNTWQNEISTLTKEDVRIVTVRDETGVLQAIFPLVVQTSWGTRVLRWISDSQINYGMPVMSQAFAASIAHDCKWLLAELMSQLDRVDAVHLDKQPATWNGKPNPLDGLFTDVGANSTYLFDLEPDFDELYRGKRSKSTRRNNKRRDAKLERLGPLVFGLPSSPDETEYVINTLFRFVETRLAGKGIKDPYGETGLTFYQALARLPKDADLQLSPYYLSSDGEIVCWGIAKPLQL